MAPLNLAPRRFAYLKLMFLRSSFDRSDPSRFSPFNRQHQVQPLLCSSRRVISWFPYLEPEPIHLVPPLVGDSDLTIYLEFEFFLKPVPTKRCSVDWNPDFVSQPISALPLFMDGGGGGGYRISLNGPGTKAYHNNVNTHSLPRGCSPGKKH